MRIKFLATILFVFIVLVSKATDISFVVYNVIGSVSKSSKTKIKKGDKILANETLVLADNASVILICSNYKTIQLNKKGSYTAKNLMDQCNKDAAGYTSSYFKYVWNEFTHPHGKPESNPGEYMKNVGAVSRGCNAVETNLPVDTIHYFDGKFLIHWRSIYSKPVLAIYDIPVDGGPLKRTALKYGYPIYTDSLTSNMQPGEYYWQITDAEGNSCERNYLKIWDRSSYEQEVDELIAQVPVSTKAETAFAKGFILQENHFLAEACKYYKKATEFSPGTKKYQNALSQFYATVL